MHGAPTSPSVTAYVCSLSSPRAAVLGGLLCRGPFPWEHLPRETHLSAPNPKEAKMKGNWDAAPVSATQETWLRAGFQHSRFSCSLSPGIPASLTPNGANRELPPQIFNVFLTGIKCRGGCPPSAWCEATTGRRIARAAAEGSVRRRPPAPWAGRRRPAAAREVRGGSAARLPSAGRLRARPPVCRGPGGSGGSGIGLHRLWAAGTGLQEPGRCNRRRRGVGPARAVGKLLVG